MIILKNTNSKQRNINSVQIGFFAMFVMLTIGDLTTNNLSRLIIEPVRYIAIVFTMITMIIVFRTQRLSKKTLISLGLYTLILVWGLILSSINGASDIGFFELEVNALVTLSGLYIYSSIDSRSVSYSHNGFYIYYIIFGIIATVAIGGLEIGLPPQFVYEYSNKILEADISYSQGISRFFGFGVLIAVYAASEHAVFKIKLILYLFASIFMFLSFLGGARGDSVFAFVLICIYLVYKYHVRFIILMIFISAMMYFTVNSWLFLEDFVIFERLADRGDYGMRDILLNQVYDLLILEPRCIFIGCGFGYFQTFYGYEAGLYPHNFIAESLVIFGLPFVMILFSISLRGISLYINEVKKIDLFIILFAYVFLIGMKSGSVLGSWFLMIWLGFFCGMNLDSYLRNTESV